MSKQKQLCFTAPEPQGKSSHEKKSIIAVVPTNPIATMIPTFLFRLLLSPNLPPPSLSRPEETIPSV